MRSVLREGQCLHITVVWTGGCAGGTTATNWRCLQTHRHWLPHQDLYARLHGTRSTERLKLHWIDNIAVDLSRFGLTIVEAIHKARNRQQWRRYAWQSEHATSASPRHSRRRGLLFLLKSVSNLSWQTFHLIRSPYKFLWNKNCTPYVNWFVCFTNILWLFIADHVSGKGNKIGHVHLSFHFHSSFWTLTSWPYTIP